MPSGASIMLRVVADLTGAVKSVDSVKGKYAQAGAGMKDAFSPALNQLNRTGVFDPFKDALDGVGDSIETVKNHINDLPVAMIAVGGAVYGLGASLEVLGSKDKAAHQQLQASVAATGKSWDDYEKPVEEAIKTQEHFGHTATDTQDALRILTQATGDPAKALHFLADASGLAAAKHESLSKAATTLGKTYNGSSRALKEFGIQVTNTHELNHDLAVAEGETKHAADETSKSHQNLAIVTAELAGKHKLTVAESIRLMKAHQDVAKAAADTKKAHDDLTVAQIAMKNSTNKNEKALDELGAKLKGQNSAAADTFSGHIAALRAKAEDAIATFGTKYGPTLQHVGMAMGGVGAAAKIAGAGISAVSKWAKDAELGQKALSAATKIATAVQWAYNVALDANPLVLIVIAIAAVIAIIVILVIKVKAVRNVFVELGHIAKEVWDKIWDAVKTVFNWIKQHWPLLLAILVGPIGLAVLAIIKNRDKLWTAIKAVWQWIRDSWHLIYDWFIKPYVDAARDIAHFMDSIWHAVKGVWDWISSNWHRIYDWIAWPFRAVIGAVEGAMSGISRAVQAVWSWISGNFSRIEGWITAPFSRAADTVRSIWGGVSSFFSGIPGKIQAAFGYAYGILLGIGGDIINGLKDGIQSGVGAVEGALHSVVDKIKNAIKNPLSILSPSRVMADEVGKPIVQGIAVGISQNAHLVNAAMGRIATNMPRMATFPVVPPGARPTTAAPAGIPTTIGARGGPLVNIEHAEFSQEMDVQKFTRSIAFQASTALARGHG